MQGVGQSWLCHIGFLGLFSSSKGFMQRVQGGTVRVSTVTIIHMQPQQMSGRKVDSFYYNLHV